MPRICEDCVRRTQDRIQTMADSTNKPHNAIVLDSEDYYYDGPYLVFTAAYHLKRGECCGSHCRHCPYGLAPESAEDHLA